MASSRRKGRPPHDDILTPAEWRIVHAVKHGMTNGEIAERRGISRDAVKFHIANALAKLGLPNRRALRRWHQAPKGSALGQLEGKMNSPLKLGPIGDFKIRQEHRAISSMVRRGTRPATSIHIRRDGVFRLWRRTSLLVPGRRHAAGGFNPLFQGR